MKKYILAFILLSCCSGLYAQKAMATPDTNQIKNKLGEFTRLYYKRTEVDSLVSFLAYPLYSKNWYGNKTWRSAAQLKKELKEIGMRARFRQTNYTVLSLYQAKSKKNTAVKGSNYTCFQMLVHLPEIGEGQNGSYVKFIFYMEKKKPNRIIGVEQEDVL